MLVDDVVQKAGRDAVAVGVAGGIRVAGTRAGGPRLVLEPAEIVGDALHEPARIPLAAAAAGYCCTTCTSSWTTAPGPSPSVFRLNQAALHETWFPPVAATPR